MPPVFGTIVNMRAAIQAAALVTPRRGGAAPYPWIEYDASANPLLDVTGIIPLAADGTVSVPDAPGTGLELDRDRLGPWVTESWICAL